MIIDPAELDRRQLNGLVNGLVYPRPIAWVSSLAADGTRNLAPFSFFNAFSFNPPTIGVGPGSRVGVNKDSLRNIKETGEFVVNLVSERLAGIANVCSAEFGPDVDEWEVSGVQPAACELVKPARVAEAPASLECRVLQIVDLGAPDMPTNSLVIARVLRIHVIDEALDGLTPKPDVLQLVGRMGGDLWCRTQDTFDLPRPGTTDAEALGRHAAALAEGLGD
jgi:flavin reductase (DIM6/NTAB) family NADH-FMN oxidoreductase RutF